MPYEGGPAFWKISAVLSLFHLSSPNILILLLSPSLWEPGSTTFFFSLNHWPLASLLIDEKHQLRARTFSVSKHRFLIKESEVPPYRDDLGVVIWR